MTRNHKQPKRQRSSFKKQSRDDNKRTERIETLIEKVRKRQQSNEQIHKHLTKGLSIGQIASRYPTSRDHDLGVIRILALQRLDDFHEMRGGEYDLSIGGSSIGKLCGVSEYETPQDAYRMHVFPEQQPKKQFSPEQQRCLDLGNQYEKVVRNALEQYTKKRCYNGGFIKLKLPFTRGSYEMLHVSPDGFLLSKEPSDYAKQFLTPEYVRAARGDPEKIAMLSKIMLPMDAIEGVCEFKLSVYAPLKRIPPSHVIQCCFQSIAIGDKPCHYVNLHIKDDIIIRMVYAIIIPTPTLKAWILERLEVLVSHMFHKLPLPENFQQQMIEVCNYATIRVVFNGAPEAAKIDKVANMNLPEEAPFF